MPVRAESILRLSLEREAITSKRRDEIGQPRRVGIETGEERSSHLVRDPRLNHREDEHPLPVHLADAFD